MFDSKVISGIAALAGIAIGFAIACAATTVAEPDLSVMKDSIEARFEHAHDSKVHADIKEDIFKRILDNINTDIEMMYPEEYHQQLKDFATAQYVKWFNM